MNAVYNNVFGEQVVQTKYCKGCDQHLPITEFRVRGEGSGVKRRLYTICRSCEKKDAKVRQYLRNQSPPKPSHCECCGKETKHLHLEHCHTTGILRGWTCEDCNTAIGRAGDNLDGVLNILKYMVERDLILKRKDDDPAYDMMLENTHVFISVARGLIKKIENG